MKVTLVDNLLIEQNGARVEAVLQPHLGLISLLSMLRAGGHEGRLFDPKLELYSGAVDLGEGLYVALAEKIAASRPDVVGFTSLGCNFICTLKVARQLRKLDRDIIILLGGPHASILDRQILERYDDFDLILRNEAEQTLLRVLENLESRAFHGIDGVTFRAGDRVISNPGAPLIEDLDALPIPAYDYYPIDKLQLDWLRVEAGRGCPFSCTFCSTASFFGRRYRLKSAERLCSELDLLHEKYAVQQFSLQHDLFTVDREKVLEFCEAVACRDYTWKCSARMDCVDRELLQVMARAGCREIYFGIETGSPRLQYEAKKRLDLTLFYPTLDAAQEAHIRPTVSFITGYPQEESADQAATLDMIGSCFYRNPPPANVQLHMMTPEPGTEMLAQFRDQLEFDGFISDFTFPTIEPDDADVIKSAPEVFMNHHYFTGQMPRARHVVVTTLYYVLYDLSPPVLTYLLDRYDGKLSRLIDDFHAWNQDAVDEAGSMTARFIAFCAMRFGAEHHLTSLVRYMTTLASMSRPTRRRALPDSGLRASRGCYLTNPEARVLRRIHDCTALLEQLEIHHARRIPIGAVKPVVAPSTLVPLRLKRGAAPHSVLREQIQASWSALVQTYTAIPALEIEDRLADYIVVPIASTGEVRCIELDPDLAVLLQIFETPRTARDIRKLSALGDAQNLLLQELVTLDLLVYRERSTASLGS